MHVAKKPRHHNDVVDVDTVIIAKNPTITLKMDGHHTYVCKAGTLMWAPRFCVLREALRSHVSQHGVHNDIVLHLDTNGSIFSHVIDYARAHVVSEQDCCAAYVDKPEMMQRHWARVQMDMDYYFGPGTVNVFAAIAHLHAQAFRQCALKNMPAVFKYIATRAYDSVIGVLRNTLNLPQSGSHKGCRPCCHVYDNVYTVTLNIFSCDFTSSAQVTGANAAAAMGGIVLNSYLYNDAFQSQTRLSPQIYAQLCAFFYADSVFIDQVSSGWQVMILMYFECQSGHSDPLSHRAPFVRDKH